MEVALALSRGVQFRNSLEQARIDAWPRSEFRDHARDPPDPLVFGDLTRCGAEDHGSLFDLGAGEAVAVELEEYRERSECGSLVAINKGMVSHDSPGNGSAEPRDRGNVFISVQVLRPCNGRLKRSVVPHSGKATVFLKESSLNIAENVSPDELNVHFASSR